MSILSAAMLALVFAGASSAQDSAADLSHPEVVITKLSRPQYRPIARTAHIMGDVIVMLGIRRDGSIESSKVISGPPLLQDAALQSAQQSQFECRDCSDAVTLYSLVYTFQLTSEGCCSTTSTPDRITQSANHVTVSGEAVCLCPGYDVLPAKVRAAKCLYLWKCGVRS
jgi:Gram-negative bacterial TonB protein C-terminal